MKTLPASITADLWSATAHKKRFCIAKQKEFWRDVHFSLKYSIKWIASSQVVNIRVEWLVEEGLELDPTEKGGRIMVAKVTGPARKILLGERPALNMLARASGIATIARELYKLKVKTGWNGLIAATRKTTPGTPN